MFCKFKKRINKVLITCGLILVIISSTFIPVFTPKAEAIFGIGDIVIDAKALIRSIVDGIAMKLAQRMVDEMVKSTVNWANSGFDDTPAFVTDPSSFLGNIADATAGDFISGSKLGFLCSPFQQNIRLSLQYSYNAGTGGEPYAPSCTVTGIRGNIDDFYNSFSNGGWDTWFSITQNDDNNPIGAYIGAKIELDREIATKLGIENKKLDWGQGFKSKGDCLVRNPTTPPDPLDTDAQSYNPNYGPGDCITPGPDKTPGSVIKDQLNKVLPTGLNKLITVDHVEQLISSFTQGLLTKFVFGPDGLLGSGNIDNIDRTVPKIGEPQISDTWTYCANEGEVCEFDGTRTVRFGSGNSDYILKQFSGTTNCSAALFGADFSTTTRWCEFANTQGTVNTYGPLKVSCYPTVAHAPKESTIEWIAEISGGSGKRPFEEVDWKLDFRKKGSVGGSNPEWELQSTNTENIFDPADLTKVVRTTIHVFAKYNGVSGTKNNSITVVDPDPSVRVEQDVSCTPIYISG